MRSPILVDTGPLVSLINSRQQHHVLCRDVLSAIEPPLVTCLPVLTEAAYLLRRHPVHVRRLLESVNEGLLRLAAIEGPDMPSVNAILDRYGDQEFQFADACLMHLAEREGVDTVFTLDRKDFTVFRKASGEALRLLPASL